MDPDTTHPTGDAPEPGEDGPDLYALRLRYQEAFEFAADCQLVTDGNGVILDANSAAAGLLGYRKEFLIGKPLPLFSATGERGRFYECLWRFAKGGWTDVFESRLVRRGQAPRYIHVVAQLAPRQRGQERPAAIHWLLRDRTEQNLNEEARAELQQRLATAQEDERRRVARDLHDTTGQLLTALALGIRAIRDAGPLSEAVHARLDHVQHITDELARQVHDLAARLRPTALDDLGLEAAVRQHVANWAARTGIAADFQTTKLAGRRFPAEVETVLFRVVQEALTNVAKHSGARRVAVILGQSEGFAVAVIEDDGAGFDTESLGQTPGRSRTGQSRLGLLGMRERVALVNGTLAIESATGQGTTIIVRLPLEPQSAR